MSVRATVANLAWLATSVSAHRNFVRALHDPAAAQERWLRAHLARNAASAYGRAHGCGDIRSYADFARRVPVSDYDELAPWIARIRAGETGVLSCEPVTRLLPTSGSTGARKLIPFTATLQREFNAAIGPWMVDLFQQFPSIALGPAYWSVTPLDESRPTEASVVPIGFDDDSRYLGGARAWLVDAAMAVPSSVRHSADLATFRRTVLLHLLGRADLRLISVWHPSFLALLLDTLVRDWDALLGDRWWARHKRRASKLRRADPRRPETIWPALRVVSCWGDAHAMHGAVALRARLPGVDVQPKGILATEAFVTVPFCGDHPLAIASHFFEFSDDHGTILPVAGLRAGETYDVIVTTGGGLWRYRLGDRVEVTGFAGGTPLLRFLGRRGNVSDLCGEKLSEAFVANVLGKLCPSARFAMLAPQANGPAPHYTLYLEDQKGPTLARRLDDALSENPNYALCRTLGQLASAEVQWIAYGGYEAFVTAEMSRGLRLGDIKPAPLSRRLDWAEHFGERDRPHPVKSKLNAVSS